MVYKLSTKISNYCKLTRKGYEIHSMCNAQEVLFVLENPEIMLWILQYHHIHKGNILSMPNSSKHNLLFFMNKPTTIWCYLTHLAIADQTLTELPSLITFYN